VRADADTAHRGITDAHDDRWLRLAVVVAFSLALHGVLLSASGSLWWTSPASRWPSQRLLVTLTPQRSASMPDTATLGTATTKPSSHSPSPHNPLPAEKTAGLHNTAAPSTAAGDAGLAAVPQTIVQPAAQPAPPAQSTTAPAAENYPVIPIANGLLAGPWYYPPRYLHRLPSPLHPIKPEYPPAAQAIAGRIVLVMLLNEKGGVDDYRIEASEPPGVFEDAAIQAFTRETYAPGMITGYPVKSQMLVEVRFEPGEAPQTTVLPALPQ
jgi:protein TonB